jgi:hypothetical protein
VATSPALEIDFIEELRMRRWARENYVPKVKRESTWHPIIHDEMVRKDREWSAVAADANANAARA